MERPEFRHPMLARTYWRLMAAIGFLMLGWFGHRVMMTPPRVMPCGCISAAALHSTLGEARLPSVVPNLYVAAKLQFVSKVDLRRADLALNIKPDIPTKPLMDKVLVIPKRFS